MYYFNRRICCNVIKRFTFNPFSAVQPKRFYTTTKGFCFIFNKQQLKICMLKYLLVGFLFLSSYNNAQAQTSISGSFEHNGITRTYSLYIPASCTSGTAVPLLLSLHGFGKSGEYNAKQRGFNAIADTANFIVAYPDGTKEHLTKQRFWNYGNIMGSKVDDAGFLQTLIDSITARYSINTKRIYCVGMSNGSFMSYLLACHTTRFAAIGAVTGSMSIKMFDACKPAKPIPIIHIHGTADPLNPYKGNSTMKAVEEVVQFWAAENKCNPQPVIIPINNTDTKDGTTAERVIYTGGTSGHSVELIKVNKGGHTWPGKKVFTLNGKTCMDFDAGVEIWRFLRQYEKVD